METNTGFEPVIEKPEKKNDRFGKGLVIGILSTFLVLMLIINCTILVLMKSGFVHIGINGEVYVQDVAVVDSDGIGSDIETKLNALDSLLDNFYFDDVDKEKAINSILKAYVSAYGDKYTVYYTQEEYKKVLETTSGKFVGIGVACYKMTDGSILAANVYESGPAYKAGMRDGDYIIKVDDQDIREEDLSLTVSKMKGEKGTSVKITVLRNGETLDFTMERDEIVIQTIYYEMEEDNIGYIEITQFEGTTAEQFKAAVEDLKSQGMKGLIIDIRENPGGEVQTTIKMLEYILPNGLYMYYETKDGNKKEFRGNDNNELDIPLAVLVNGNSASAAEIFAAAIQDYDKGEIIGTQTFGKGIVQTVRPLTDGSAVKYTIAKYHSGKGQDIHEKGVTPDQVVELPDDAEDDYQYNAAEAYIKSQMK